MAQEAPQTDLVTNMLRRVVQIKKDHPEISRRVDQLEDELRELMKDIRVELGDLARDRDRKLMTVYLINLTHKAIDEILAD